MLLDKDIKLQFSYTVNAIQVDSEVTIGADLKRSISLDFSETSSAVLAALAKIDGNRSLADILLNSELSEEEQEDFLAIVNLCIEHKLLESVDVKEKALRAGQVANEYERFDRQINLFKHITGSFPQAIDIQKKISSSSVSLVGLGGCGSYIYYALSAMGIGTLKAYEFDVVEKSNLARQILYTHEDIGRKKIDVAQEKSEKISPSTEYTFYDKKIENFEDSCEVFQDVNLVIIAADSPRPDFFYLMSKAAYHMNKPVLYVGSSTDTAVIGPLLIPGKTRCYQCIYGENTFNNDFDFVKRIQRQYTTTLIDPYNAIAGSSAALEAIKYLTNFDACQILERAIFMDFSDYQITYTEQPFKGHCSICG